MISFEVGYRDKIARNAAEFVSKTSLLTYCTFASVAMMFEMV